MYPNNKALILYAWDNHPSLGVCSTTCYRIRATLGCSFILKHVIIVYTSSLYENTSKTTRHSCFTLGTIVQTYEFVQTTCFGIHATLGCSFIKKHVVIIFTSSLYDNESKTMKHSPFAHGTIIHDKLDQLKPNVNSAYKSIMESNKVTPTHFGLMVHDVLTAQN